jgi:hypothetical protein
MTANVPLADACGWMNDGCASIPRSRLTDPLCATSAVDLLFAAERLVSTTQTVAKGNERITQFRLLPAIGLRRRLAEHERVDPPAIRHRRDIADQFVGFRSERLLLRAYVIRFAMVARAAVCHLGGK